MMRSMLIPAVCSALAVSAPAPAADKIVGGYPVSAAVPAGKGLYDFYMLLEAEKAPGEKVFCGGSLIAPRWVMTAAHCVSKQGRALAPEQLRIGTGSKPRPQAEKAVAAVYVHPDYDGKALGQDDIALLHLQEALPIAPVALPREDLPSGSWLKVAGRGALAEPQAGSKPLYPEQLQVVALPLLDGEYCGAGFDAKRQLCAGVLAGGADSCQGDSGGALFRAGVSAAPAVQYGIVSVGAGCARANMPGVYTRVVHYLPWIKQTLGKAQGQLRQETKSAAPLPVLPQAAKGDRALLIGVGRYYLPGLTLQGPAQDVAAMRAFLQTKMGFLPGQIYTLTDEQATRRNIIQAVQQWLIAQSGAGHRVWLYVSGHGAYLPDLNGDEQAQGIDAHVGMAVDETILPYDTDILTAIPSKTDVVIPLTANHILDDEIDQWLQALRGREVTVVFDTCHSGTATRGNRQRLKSAVLPLLALLPKAVKTAAKTGTGIVGQGQQQQGLSHPLPYVSFWSAVKSDETAKDAPPGVFTRAFIQGAGGAADHNGDSKITYAELLAYVQGQTRAFDMTPQLESGAGRLDEDIFLHVPGYMPQPAAPVFAGQNSAGLRLEIVDEAGRVVDAPAYCPALPCPQYYFRVQAEKPGWLLLYLLDDKQRLIQVLPNRQFKQDSFLNPGVVRDIKIYFSLNDPTPGMALAVLLDPAAKARYEALKKRLANRRYMAASALRELINRGDATSKASFSFVDLLK